MARITIYGKGGSKFEIDQVEKIEINGLKLDLDDDDKNKMEPLPKYTVYQCDCKFDFGGKRSPKICPNHPDSHCWRTE